MPAFDFHVDCKRQNQEQQRTVLSLMKKEDYFDLSSSLSFSVLNFIEKQSAFAHDIVRLAKYWYKSANLEYVYGGKYSIELIAVNAANTAVQGDHFDGFKKFLLLILDFKNICISFNDEQSKDLIKPVILDPTNPNNNLAKNFSENAINTMKVYAKNIKKTITSDDFKKDLNIENKTLDNLRENLRCIISEKKPSPDIITVLREVFA